MAIVVGVQKHAARLRGSERTQQSEILKSDSKAVCAKQPTRRMRIHLAGVLRRTVVLTKAPLQSVSELHEK